MIRRNSREKAYRKLLFHCIIVIGKDIWVLQSKSFSFQLEVCGKKWKKWSVNYFWNFEIFQSVYVVKTFAKSPKILIMLPSLSSALWEASHTWLQVWTQIDQLIVNPGRTEMLSKKNHHRRKVCVCKRRK